MKKKVASGIMLTLLLIGMLALAFNIQPAEAYAKIYIRPDGSVDPPTAPIQRIGDTYRFTQDIYNISIEVQKDNIVLDGNGHLLQGFQGITFYGVYLNARQGVTVTNVVFSGFNYNIFLDHSSNNRIIGNTLLSSLVDGIKLLYSHGNTLTNNIVTNSCQVAIYLDYSDDNVLSGNTVTGNVLGIILYDGTNNTLRNNVMAANQANFDVWGYLFHHFINDVDTSNTVDGKPIYYWINRHDQTVPLDAGTVIVVNSSRITVENLIFKNNIGSVTFAYTNDSLIENVMVTNNSGGIVLSYSHSNIVARNNITNLGQVPGIGLSRSNHNHVADNYVANTDASGIWLEDTSYNKVTGNTVINSSGGTPQEHDGAGILVDDSLSTEVIGNVLIGNLYGVVVGAAPSTLNLIVENSILRNDVGILFGWMSSYNKVYHNTFNESKRQVVSEYECKNTFDNGYPSGGNYWSDYAGWDANNDGIGDTPNVFDVDNQDRYPLMSPYGSPPLLMYTLTITTTAGGTTNPPPGSYRHSQGQKIPVRATPNSGYMLDHWELDGNNVGSSNPVNITMNSDHNLDAVFAMLTYAVTIKAHCKSQGVDVGVSITMDGSPTGYATPHTFTGLIGSHTFTVPSSDMSLHPFKQWDTGQTEATMTVSAAGTYIAYYDIKYALTLTSTFGGTTNPALGTYDLWSGTIASITAQPDTGYYLDSWQLDSGNIGVPSPVIVVMNKNHTLHASFKQLSPGHDVAVKYVASKTVVGQGQFSTIEVTAMNVGSYSETFNVTVYVNITSIASSNVTLESGASTIIDFIWNTASFTKGRFTMTAQASQVPDETNTTDNTFVSGYVIVSMSGDISGPAGVPDGIIDLDDVVPIASSFGASKGLVGSYWHSLLCINCPHNPNVDITDDGIIDLDDVIIPALHFGEVDP